MKIALLFGGRSGEHEVSLRSAASVAAGLAARHEVLPVLVDKAGRWLLQDPGELRPSRLVTVGLWASTLVMAVATAIGLYLAFRG